MFRPAALARSLSLTVFVSFLVVTCAARAAEFPESPDDPSAFTTVIDPRDYDDQFETVEDVLSQVAGLRVRRFGGLGSPSTASIRGSKSEQVLVLLDGVRLNSAHRGSVDLSTLSLRSIGRIEVIRGGGAARYGSDAVGGVISITTRAPDGGAGVDAAFTAGSYETLGADLFISLPDAPVRSSLAYSRLRSDNDFRFDLLPSGLAALLGLPPSRHTRLNADFVQDTGIVNLARDLGPSSELVGTFNVFRKDGGQPGSTLGVPVGSPDDVINCTSADEEYRRGIGGLKWRERAFGEGSLEASVSYRYERSELHDPGRCFFSPFLPIGDDVQTTESESSGELRWASRMRRLGPVSLFSRASVSGRFDQLRTTGSESKDRIWGNAFVQQDWHFFDSRLRLVPALGFEAADTSSGLTRVKASTRPVEVDVEDDPEWLPRIGAILRLAPGLRLKSNYLRAYRRPNFTELFHPDYGFVRGNPTLAPEDSWNFDVGLELMRESLGPVSGLRLEAVWFQRDIEESIEWVLFGTTTIPMNTGEARARGWELQSALTVLERLRLFASYTFLDTEIRETGVPLPHSPENQLFVRGDLPLGPFRFWGEVTYEDEFALVSSAASRVAPETTLLDAGVSLRPALVPGLRWLPHGITLSSQWVNLLGEERVDSLGLPLPDDTLFFLTVRGEFR